MDQKDKQILSFFIQKMNMFIPEINKNNIISFMHGYEVGKNKKILTKNITDLLTEKYKISYDAIGWPKQIERYALKHSIDWVGAFKQICNKILNA